MNHPDPHIEPAIDETALRRELAQLQSLYDTNFSRRFFTRLLEARGPQGLLDFLDKATLVIDNQEKLDLDTDFDAFELHAFTQTRQLLSRRQVIGAMVLGLPGTLLAAHGTLGVVEQVLRDKDEAGLCAPEPKALRVQHIRSGVAQSALPVGEVVAGAWGTNKLFEMRLAKKLQEVADAVEELSTSLDRRAPMR